MIKNFIRLAFSVLAFLCLQACEKAHSYIDDSDPVLSAYQLSGSWQLTKWRGETFDGAGRYCYLKFESKDGRFELYQNFDSAQPRHITGTFTLKYDEKTGRNIIKGVYDHASGYWNNDYVISDFGEQSMIWTVKNDETDVSVYSRCDGIPLGI